MSEQVADSAGKDAGRFGVPTSFHEKPVTRIYKAEDMARAWDEGYSQCASDCGHYQYQTRPTNPYRVLPATGPKKCVECGGSQVIAVGLPDIYKSCPTCVTSPA